MAKNKKTPMKKVLQMDARIEIRFRSSDLARLKKFAAAKGLQVSGYIREATLDRMKSDNNAGMRERALGIAPYFVP